MVGGFLMRSRVLGFRFTGSALSLRTGLMEMSALLMLVAVLVDIVWFAEPEPEVKAVIELVKPKTRDLELETHRSGRPSWLTMVLVFMWMPELTGAELGASRLKG